MLLHVSVILFTGVCVFVTVCVYVWDWGVCDQVGGVWLGGVCD